MAALIAFSIIGPLTIHLILPALPSFQARFDADYPTIQLLISAFAVAFGFAQLFVGILADVFGPRRVLSLGLLFYGAVSLLSVFATTIEVLIALRVVQAVCVCSGAVIARSLVRDHWPLSDATRILGYVAIGVAIGPMIGPTIGGVIFEHAGWRGVFLAMAAFGLGAAGVAAMFVPAQSAPTGNTRGLADLRADLVALLRSRSFRLYWLCVCFNSGTVFPFIVGAPWVGLTYLHLSPTAFGLWFATGSIGYAAGNFIVGRVPGSVAPQRVILIGVLSVVATTAAMLGCYLVGVKTPVLIFATWSGIMFSTGLLMPHAFAGAMSAVKGVSATASGFVGFAQYAVGALMSSVAAFLMDRFSDPAWLGAVMLVSAGFALCVALILNGKPSEAD